MDQRSKARVTVDVDQVSLWHGLVPTSAFPFTTDLKQSQFRQLQNEETFPVFDISLPAAMTTSQF